MENHLRDLSNEKRLDNLGSSQALAVQSLEPCASRTQNCGKVDLPPMTIEQPKLTGYSQLNADYADAAALGAAALSFERNIRDWGKRDTHGLAAAPLAALSGVALYEDGKNLMNSKTFGDGAYAASAALLDLTATAGFALSTVPKFREIGNVVGSMSVSARGALALGDQVAKEVSR